MKRILIVEDDLSIRNILKKYLKSHGYEVDEVGSILDFRKKLYNDKFDLVLLDIMLPDGFSINELPDIKVNFPDLGVIIISARDSDNDKIYGLEIGADDYVAKPFNPREVIARIKSYFRRISKNNEYIKYGPLEIFCENYVVKLDNNEVEMTAKEFEVLCLLAKNPNYVFSREKILDTVWGDEFISDRVVDVHISNIRNKIGKSWIKTIRGAGYKFNPRGYDV
ncbi:response regulator transcription factor [Thermosipho globiformans]|uniref:response regulator transcription factor n=1 Tax=Thermosipho globiformans TaxID=380685 RepID=UPI000F8F116F|nr:response regulator transcription factor [Thermosipho globiformans]